MPCLMNRMDMTMINLMGDRLIDMSLYYRASPELLPAFSCFSPSSFTLNLVSIIIDKKTCQSINSSFVYDGTAGFATKQICLVDAVMT